MYTESRFYKVLTLPPFLLFPDDLLCEIQESELVVRAFKSMREGDQKLLVRGRNTEQRRGQTNYFSPLLRMHDMKRGTINSNLLHIQQIFIVVYCTPGMGFMCEWNNYPFSWSIQSGGKGTNNKCNYQMVTMMKETKDADMDKSWCLTALPFQGPQTQEDALHAKLGRNHS